MALFEETFATWTKRFMQNHYSYRDFESDLTGDLTTYVFGTNARAITRFNWPALGDYALARPCYARSVMVQCTEDCFIVLTCLNPEYMILLAQGYTPAQIVTTLGVPLTINEVPTFIPAAAMITFNPTYGTAISHYAYTAIGAIYIWVEGNVEGQE